MPVNYKIKWDQTGERFFENGCNHGVLYPMAQDSTYPKGVAWNGLTGVDENPDGADVTDIWADNIKYASFRSPENHKGNIKAYTYPAEWKRCNGMYSPTNLEGVTVGQQKRQNFGFCYRSEIANDTGTNEGYLLHLVYNSTVSPSQTSRSTKNENPDAVEFSWDYESTPVPVTAVTGVEQTSTMELSSLLLTQAQMEAIEAVLYGTAADGSTAAVEGRLPLPDEVISIITAAG